MVAILRMIVALVILPATPIALAEEALDANTKIEFKINEGIYIQDGIAYPIAFQKVAFNYDGYIPVKTEEEQKREQVLEKWKSKQSTKSAPKGKFTINASAYTAAADECGKSDGITASGVKVKEKRTLACPPQYAFGTKIKIEGFGTYVCEDRGGAIKGNHFDVYMETKKEAFAFGRRNLLAEVVN